MAENSNIEWTDHTFNPWIGCTKVSAACDNCYAEAWDARGLQGGESRWGPHADRTRTSAANWRKPLAWNRAAQASGTRARVFCASLADVFDNHRSIRGDWRSDLWNLIAATPHLDWLLLTKRPQNIARFLPTNWLQDPAPNIWLGTTVENQTEAERRVPVLLGTPARVRFLSVEPMLGRVDLGRATLPFLRHKSYMNAHLHWVICGGESGRGARPMHPDWARSLRDQCFEAGVPFFFKQWGEHVFGTERAKSWRVTPQEADQRLKSYPHWGSPDGKDIIYRVGKKAAGRLLDGREWNQMPGAGE